MLMSKIELFIFLNELVLSPKTKIKISKNKMCPFDQYIYTKVIAYTTYTL